MSSFEEAMGALAQMKTKCVERGSLSQVGLGSIPYDTLMYNGFIHSIGGYVPFEDFLEMPLDVVVDTIYLSKRGAEEQMKKMEAMKNAR